MYYTATKSKMTTQNKFDMEHLIGCLKYGNQLTYLQVCWPQATGNFVFNYEWWGCQKSSSEFKLTIVMNDVMFEYRLSVAEAAGMETIKCSQYYTYCQFPRIYISM